MFEEIWTYIVFQITHINYSAWTVLFFISIIFDIVYTKSVLYISRLIPKKAAITSVLLYLLTAIGTINYVKNPFNLVPICIGAWIGSYFILKYEAKLRAKRKKNGKKEIKAS